MPNTKTLIPFRGTPEQEAKLKEVIEQYKSVPGGTMPVMQQAQDIYGYLPEEVQIMIAEGLGVPLEEVSQNAKPRVVATSQNNIIEEYFTTHHGLDARVEGRIEILD